VFRGGVPAYQEASTDLSLLVSLTFESFIAFNILVTFSKYKSSYCAHYFTLVNYSNHLQRLE